MNQLTTIAALPGSGAGCASRLPAEVGKAKEKTPEPPGWLLAGIVRQIMDRPIREWLESEEGEALIQKFREPAPRAQYSKPCPVKFEDPKEDGPTPADMAAHPAWGGVPIALADDTRIPLEGVARVWIGGKLAWERPIPVDTDSEGSL